jgi:hypothetical protein
MRRQMKLSKVKDDIIKGKKVEPNKNKLNKFKATLIPKNLPKRLKMTLSSRNRKRIMNVLISATLLLVALIAILGPPPRSQLSSNLMRIKIYSQDRFNGILNEIEQNPLNELLGDKLPTSEEIFYAEWANNRFPHIDIPIVGSIVEEFGAEKVGDIDFDGLAPNADLNMTTLSNPSNLTLKQCDSLWSRNDPYSFLVDWPDLWYKALDNDQESSTELLVHFNLSYSQFELIINWLNTSMTGWMNNLQIPVYSVSPTSSILALLILAGGIVASDHLYTRNYYLHQIKRKLEKRKAAKLKNYLFKSHYPLNHLILSVN